MAAIYSLHGQIICSLILCGESYLNNTLSKPIHEALNQRIIDNVMTDALTIGTQKNKTAIDDEVILSAVSSQNSSDDALFNFTGSWLRFLSNSQSFLNREDSHLQFLC